MDNNDYKIGGAIKFKKNQILADVKSGDYSKFFQSRYSIRNYSEEDVPTNLIAKGIAGQANLPSVLIISLSDKRSNNID